MDLHDLVTKFELHLQGVIHVGAHTAEEAPIYDALGAAPIYWVEANPAVIPIIEENIRPFPNQMITEALVLDAVYPRINFHVTNYDGMSSSVYRWGTHTNFSPDTVVVQTIELDSTTVDALGFKGVNMMNIDVEGAGLDVLKGSVHTLEAVDILYLEVQTDNVYDGAPQLSEVQAWLTDFDLVELGMVENQGWGDALFLRRK